jgi:hypothetical protein
MSSQEPTWPALTRPLAIVAGLNLGSLGLAWFFAYLQQLSVALVLLLASVILSVVQLAIGIRAMFRPASRWPGIWSSLAAAVIGLFSFFLLGIMALGGSGWGRPLRIRGRQLHSNLRKGTDWTSGDRPEVSALDNATRKALAALWLHDAQKEHASVPAFSRISWMLAAVGAPAELLAWSHRAALEEIEHAQKCFALAAGYGGVAYTVEPMPELLIGGLDSRADPLVTLATESLGDGCQLEDFNADVAAECATICGDPVTRAVLEQIAREERSHAEFSWAVLQWLVSHAGDAVRPALADRLRRLEEIRRPTAVSWQKLRLVAAADPAQLRRHGRIPDGRWGELWAQRLDATRRRATALLAETPNDLACFENGLRRQMQS